MPSRMVLTAGLAVLAIVGCRPKDDPAAVEAALRDTDVAFARATADSGADGWVAYFADDGVMFRPGGVIQGRDSIRAVVTAWFADDTFSLSWEPTHAEGSEAEDLGYTYGRYQSTGRDATGAVIRSTGSYVTVWRRQPDGTWKVALDVGTPDR